MEEKPDPGRVRSSSTGSDGKDLVSPADEGKNHHRRSHNAGESSVDVTDSGISISVGNQDHGGDDRVTVLDVLDKGSPPPTTGDPSPGRNHVVLNSGVIGSGDGSSSIDKDGGHIRVVLVETLDKSSKPPSSGDPSTGRKTISMRATVSVSSQSTSHGVNGLGSDDSKERTSASGSHGSKPNKQGQ